MVLRRQRSLYKQFIRTGGVLWASPGALLKVQPILGAAATFKPEAETWPGYIVLTETQVAWAVESGNDFSQGIVSLLGITKLSRKARQLRIRYIEGNPRQPVILRGALRDLMASTADAPQEVALDFASSRAAEQLEQLIQRQQTVARARWPALAVPHETDNA